MVLPSRKRLNTINFHIAKFVASAGGQRKLADYKRALDSHKQKVAKRGQLPVEKRTPVRQRQWPPVEAFRAEELSEYHCKAQHRMVGNWRDTCLITHEGDAVGRAAHSAAFDGIYVQLTHVEYCTAFGLKPDKIAAVGHEAEADGQLPLTTEAANTATGSEHNSCGCGGLASVDDCSEQPGPSFLPHTSLPGPCFRDNAEPSAALLAWAQGDDSCSSYGSSDEEEEEEGEDRKMFDAMFFGR
uniref:DUF4817 domain-containing protein n=1 Tax=Globodera pallida TaxID=36090 RepID=A0A183C624_GLOPA